MNNAYINEKVAELFTYLKGSPQYQTTFNEVYDEVLADVRPKLTKIARSLLMDEDDVISLYSDKLLEALDKFKEGDFARLLSVMIKNARCDELRKRLTRYKFEDYGEEEYVFESAPTLERYIEPYNLENEVIMRANKKNETEKRQLLNFILQAAKPDQVTRSIVDEFPNHKTINSLAKALGLDHRRVKRKLEKLARYYDANRFGDIEFYLIAN